MLKNCSKFLIGGYFIEIPTFLLRFFNSPMHTVTKTLLWKSLVCLTLNLFKGLNKLFEINTEIIGLKVVSID